MKSRNYYLVDGTCISCGSELNHCDAGHCNKYISDLEQNIRDLQVENKQLKTELARITDDEKYGDSAGYKYNHNHLYPYCQGCITKGKEEMEAENKRLLEENKNLKATAGSAVQKLEIKRLRDALELMAKCECKIPMVCKEKPTCFVCVAKKALEEGK